MSEEKEIFSCHVALALEDDFFTSREYMTERDLLPVIHSLVKEFDGKIKDPGTYAFRLQITKMK